jgi:hypothetical protein
MPIDSASKRRENEGAEQRSFAARVWPVLIELWMAGLLAACFVIRILGSGLGQRLLARLGHG